MAGTTYQIAVDAFYGRLGDFGLALKLLPAVENDQFADALNLSGSTIVVRGSNVGASKEPGEPDHAFGTAAHSVWWNWTAPFTGGAELSVDQSDFSTRLGIYTGSAVDNLTPVTPFSSFGRTQFRAVSGTTYRIVLDGWSQTTGNYQFSLRLFPPPANDQFRNATPVLGTIAAMRGSNFGASKELSEPDHAGDPGGQSVWWTWTAPYTGGVELDPGQRSFETLVGVYTGDSVEALTLVAHSRDFLPIRFRALGGTTYRLAVDGRGEASFDIFLRLRLLPPVENDQFADAIPIQGAAIRVYGSNVGATSELGEPSHAGNPPNRSVWWAWTAPFTGRADLSATGSDFNAALAVYTGGSVTALTEVASAALDQPLAFRAQSGSTYRIAVDGTYENAGQIVLRVNLRTCQDQIIVVTTQDGGPGSLRQAITDLCPGGTIEFDPGLRGQAILATDGPLVIDKDLTIAGLGAGQLTVTAESRNSVFAITHGKVAISGLTIRDGASQFGGGIFNLGHLTLTRCLVTANRAPSGNGGGIYNGFTGTLTVLNSSLSANSSEAGGAIYNSGQAVVINATIGPANLASFGGGYDGGGDLAMTNSTVAGNVATQWGGGLLGRAREGVFNSTPSRMTLVSCTVANNTAGRSGGGYAQLSAADIELWNTLIARNGAALAADIDRFAPVDSLGHNLIGTLGRTWGWTATDLIGTDPAPIDPLLGLLQDNGGPTFTLALSPGSPAVNRGDPSFSSPPFTDQRGPGYPRVVGGRIDIGALERENGSPLLACSSPVRLECASPNGTMSLLNVTVQDPDGDELNVVWSVNGINVQTNRLPAGTTAQPSTFGLAAIFVLGQHTVVAVVSNRTARPVFCTNTVTVLDTTSPSLWLVGSNPFTNLNLTPFKDPGAVAIDLCDGDLTGRISVSGPSDLNAPGHYTFIYSVTDTAGNTTTATRRVVVAGPREVLQSVLAELNMLRATVMEKHVRKKLDEATEQLTGALGLDYWIDQAHLQRKHGAKAFREAKEAVAKLLELLKDRPNSIPAGVLEDFMARIVRATRLLASTAISDGIHAGAGPKRIDKARGELAKGDHELAEGKPDKAIDSYQNAWKTAVGTKVVGIVRLASGSIRLDIVGFPGETYTIQASTDMVRWENVGECTADQAGAIRFEDSVPGKQRARFYRLLSLEGH